MGALRNLIHFVGLTEEEENHTGRLAVQERPKQSHATDGGAEPAAAATPSYPRATESGRPASPAPVAPMVEPTPIRAARPVAAVSTPVAPAGGDEVNRIETVHPTTFNDVRIIGDVFREGIPVIMNLTALEHEVAVRMVDFATGLIYGTRGNITRVTERVFLLTPKSVEATEGEAQPVAKEFSILR